MRAAVDRRLRGFGFLPGTTKAAASHALFASGNRMRPILYLTAVGAASGDWRSDGHLAMACLLEMFHKTSLVLDDIMDGDHVRKGKPTVHAMFGPEQAYIAGIAMLIACYDRVMGQVASHRLSSGDMDLLRTAIRRTLTGQVADVGWSTSARDRATYVALTRGKTGALCRLCMELAANRTAAPPRVKRALVAYGESLGAGYQILNDLKCINGAERDSGRGHGADLLDGRPSMVEVVAREKGIALSMLSRALRENDGAVLEPVGRLVLAEALSALDVARGPLASIWGRLRSPYRDGLVALTSQVASTWSDADWDLRATGWQLGASPRSSLVRSARKG